MTTYVDEELSVAIHFFLFSIFFYPLQIFFRCTRVNISVSIITDIQNNFCVSHFVDIHTINVSINK